MSPSAAKTGFRSSPLNEDSFVNVPVPSIDNLAPLPFVFPLPLTAPLPLPLLPVSFVSRLPWLPLLPVPIPPPLPMSSSFSSPPVVASRLPFISAPAGVYSQMSLVTEEVWCFLNGSSYPLMSSYRTVPSLPILRDAIGSEVTSRGRPPSADMEYIWAEPGKPLYSGSGCMSAENSMLPSGVTANGVSSPG